MHFQHTIATNSALGNYHWYNDIKNVIQIYMNPKTFKLIPSSFDD